MALISFQEILELIIMTLVIGYIFTGLFKFKIKTAHDYMRPSGFDWQEFKFAVLVAAPAIVLHELGHKFVAMAYGYSAEFHMFTFGLALGVILKLISAPFIIIAPGFVSIPAVSSDLIYRLIAFAGPFVNLVLWIGSMLILKFAKNLPRTNMIFLAATKKLNMILFFFNMIPFGPLDGAKVLFGMG